MSNVHEVSIDDASLKGAGSGQKLMVNVSSGFTAKDFLEKFVKVDGEQVEIHDAFMPYNPPYECDHPNKDKFVEILYTPLGGTVKEALNKVEKCPKGRTSTGSGKNQAKVNG